MKERRTIIYYCTSVYQILIMLIMAELYYREYDHVLILEKTVADKLNLSATIPYISKVVILTPNASENEIDRVLKDVLQQNQVSKIGWFTWGVRGKIIYARIPDTIPVMLLDEGVSTCDYKRFMTCAVGEINCTGLKEIWMLNPSISQNDGTIPEYRIEVEQLFETADRLGRFLEAINSLFRYQYEDVMGDVLFFDRYLVQLGRIPVKYERFVLQNLVRLTTPYHLEVKPHPSEQRKLTEWRYRELPITFYPAQDIPWELTVLNYIHCIMEGRGSAAFPKILISTNTTALLATQQLLSYVGKKIPIVYINKIIHNYLAEIEIVAESTIESYQTKNPDQEIYIPNDWDELCRVFNRYLDTNLDRDIIAEIRRQEQDILEREYRKSLQVEGNLLHEVRLEVYSGKTEKEYATYITYVIGGEEKYRVTFDHILAEEGCTMLRLLPTAGEDIYSKIFVEKVKFKKEDTCVEEIELRREYGLSMKRPYVEVPGTEKMFERIEIEYSITEKYSLFREVEQHRRFRNYYRTLITWIQALQREDCFKNFCEKHGYSRIGIYGNGEIGQLLRNQFVRSGVEAELIDKREFTDSILPETALKKMDSYDLVIVTPLFDFYNIYCSLGKSEKVVDADTFWHDVMENCEEDEK